MENHSQFCSRTVIVSKCIITQLFFHIELKMELVNAALKNNKFGLRRRFQWTRDNLNDTLIQTWIRRKEERYLNDLFEDVFDEDEYLDIQRIENPYLWGQYALRYEEMKACSQSRHVEELIMIHATSADNAYNIAKENFNWRLVERARFGKGVSFASDPTYADRRATKNDVFIVAGVLVANSRPGNWDQEIPKGNDDTTTGYTEDVCIKYYDSDFYPYYIVQ